MDTLVNSDLLLGWSARICCLGVLLQSSEILWHRRELQDDGLFGWEVSDRAPATPLRRVSRCLHGYPACFLLLVGRAGLAATGLWLPAGNVLVVPVLALLFLAQLYFNRRYATAGSGSDTMQLMVLAAALAGSLPGGTARLKTAALVFLAVQVLLAYVASGWDKITSARWRSGVPLKLIFKYSHHRFPSLGDWCERHPRVACGAAWSVLLMELSFPVCLLLPAPGFWVYLAGGLAFHAVVAFTMGLHGFWWSFAAAYPALYFAHGRIAALLPG